LGGQYGIGSGSSYAAPFVTAAAAMVREVIEHYGGELAGSYATFSERFADLIISTGEPIDDAASDLTYPRLNMYELLVRTLNEVAGPATNGDTNADGYVDALDIDFIHAAMRGGHYVAVADLNADGNVNKDDVAMLVHQVLGTWFGDATIDRWIAEDDLSTLADNWHKPVRSWGDGDFNGDGMIDEADLAFLADNWKRGVAGGASTAVPEPGSLALALCGGLLILRRRASRR
jgi:hypothetical protein